MPPQKTITAYKQFRVLKHRPGLFPLFINKSVPTPQREWVEAHFFPTKGYAPRPGWHAGTLPIAPHLRQKTTGRIWPNRIWAEIEVSADIDWQPIADKSPTKDLRNQVPINGYYCFHANKMQSGLWIIGGEIKIVRILSSNDIQNILSNYPQSEINAELQ